MRNRFEITGGSVDIFQVPLKTPFITAAGEKTATTNVGLVIRLKGGASGYGEASGSVVHANLKPERLAAALRGELRRAVGSDVRDIRRLVGSVWTRCAALPPAAAALECALLDALTGQLGIPMREWHGGAAPELESDITLSAAGAVETEKATYRALEDGFRVFKIKVGTGYAKDIARISAAWEVLQLSSRHINIILDGNQGMSVASALKLLDSCARKAVPVVLFEQPLPRGKLAESARLKRRSRVPIAADEDVRSAADALRVLDADAADVFNIKVAKTGIQESLNILSLARAAKKQLMIGCMQESAKGLDASVHLAMGTGAFEFVDLDSDHLLVPQQPRGSFTRIGPTITLATE